MSKTTYKRVRGWAVICLDESINGVIEYGDYFNPNGYIGETATMAIFEKEKDAIEKVRVTKRTWHKIVPCTITYALPSKEPLKVKKSNSTKD